jgi:hypothetical protein
MIRWNPFRLFGRSILANPDSMRSNSPFRLLPPGNRNILSPQPIVAATRRVRKEMLVAPPPTSGTPQQPKRLDQCRAKKCAWLRPVHEPEPIRIDSAEAHGSGARIGEAKKGGEQRGRSSFRLIRGNQLRPPFLSFSLTAALGYAFFFRLLGFFVSAAAIVFANGNKRSISLALIPSV